MQENFYQTTGFPSPANDYIEDAIDLNRELIKNPVSTVFMRVDSSNWIDFGYFRRDLLLIDKSLLPQKGNHMIYIQHGSFNIGRFDKNKFGNWITSHDGEEATYVDESVDIFGVIIAFFRPMA